MAKPGMGAEQIARSKTKIVQSAVEVADGHRHIAQTQRALARSLKLLKRVRDPLRLDRR